jgi:Domain of unknown function (DUF4350)
MGRAAMTTTTAVGPTIASRWRSIRWVLLALVLIVGVSALATSLTASRSGGRLEAESTSADGARALVSLLRDNGIDVVEADSVADVARAARPDSLLVVVETSHAPGVDELQRLAAVPGDRLLTEPLSRTREALAPAIRVGEESVYGGPPACDMSEANRAGEADFGASQTYVAAADVPVVSCYDGAVVRYSDGGHTVTVVGGADFMTNSKLLREGNAALAMNLAGTRSRVIWYAPTGVDGDTSGSATLMDLIPERVDWMVLQLCLAVALVALWRIRRVGPLVAEDLPVVVRASEAVEGRGRLYRSRRARDRAADALRTATLARMLPRLGLGPNAAEAAVVQTVCHRTGRDPNELGHWLFGSAPATDADLVDIARHLDDIERQVRNS